MLRKALYEAGNVALSQVKRPFALQEWGRKMVEAKGGKYGRTTVARRLAALLHSLWLNETEFCWA
jgi:transposase